jgi:AraC family transcriptional regulator
MAETVQGLGIDCVEGRLSRIAAIGGVPLLTLASQDGRCLLSLADYQAHEGEFIYSDRLHLHLCVGHGGRIRRRNDGQKLDARMRPGLLGIAIPGTEGTGGWEPVRLLGLGIDLSCFADGDKDAPRPETFVPMASHLQENPLVRAVLTAIWREAEIYGLGSAFFDHGILLLRRHLLQHPQSIEIETKVRALPRQRLDRVIACIESNLADDIGVAELAALVGMSRHHFSRAVKAATGLAPFELITARRMSNAQRLLSETDLTVTAIAAAVGYANPSKFAAAFMRICGMNPTRWRASRQH